MQFTKYIALLCCIVVLLVFLPISDGWWEFPEEERLPNRVGTLFGDEGPSGGLGGGDNPWGAMQSPYIEDNHGNPIPVPGEDPLNKIPVNTKYHAGIPETAQKMNDEFFKLCTYYASKSNSKNPQALALYLLAAPDLEQRGHSVITDENLFITSPYTQEQYEKDPDVIKLATEENKRGTQKWYEPDGWKLVSLGPHSIYEEHFNTSLEGQSFNEYKRHIPNIESFGTSIGAQNPPRQNNGHVGDKNNWYDSAQMMAGMVNSAWSRKNKYIEFNDSNPYAYIAYTCLAQSYGESVLTGGYSSLQARSGYEKMSPRFASEYCAFVSEAWAIDYIRDWVRKNKPYSMNAENRVKEELLRPLSIKVREEALKRDPNFFSDERYIVTEGNVYIKSGVETGKLADFQSEYANKISAPLRILIETVILEERYAGTY